jgi:signal transduction histidine kinase
MKTDTSSNQLRWVILLLAAAVILPTVCLLWFMNQAVKNERLATRTKLQNAYYSEISRVFMPFLEWHNTDSMKARETLDNNTPYQAYKKLASAEADFDYKGLFIYDITNKELLYPTTWDNFEETDQLQEAIQLEFVDSDLQAAFEAYSVIEKNDPNSLIAKHCKLAQARILQKQKKYDIAIEYCEMLKAEPLDNPEQWHLYTASNLKILHLLEQIGLDDDKRTVQFNSQFTNLLNVISDIELVTCDQRIFLFDQLKTLSDKHPKVLSRKTSNDLKDLQEQIDLEEQTLDFIFTHPEVLDSQFPYRMVEYIEGTDLYSINHYFGKIRATRVVNLKEVFGGICSELNFPGDIYFRVLDSEGNLINGPEDIEQTPFLQLPVAFFFDWTVELYETDANANAFEQAAQRQTSIYIWTSVLVIVLGISAGALSIRSVNQQIKMNRLKNDFIATVTHELKTPLASMRLLVDTLLEGNYEGEQTATEYLQLVANENKRLTHLIDSFLTFSRMERNKQVFDFQPVVPGDIAAAAAESMQGKLSRDNCNFTCTVNENLPLVSADKDGMVTVLVNLLDNACKYTNSDKQIELKVYEQNGSICFAVKDNGIGLSKRAQSKIFNRFYQADSRLSRSVEGCGLGLSIVKFIVEAHKGNVEVESQQGQGSTFTIKLPKA